MRVELLRDLTEMTKALGMADPNFPTPALTVGKVRDTQTIAGFQSVEIGSTAMGDS